MKKKKYIINYIAAGEEDSRSGVVECDREINDLLDCEDIKMEIEKQVGREVRILGIMGVGR